MSDFIKSWTENAAKLTAAHAYHPSQEHDACGVGLVAAIDGKPRRDVVLAGIEALKAVWHRGAVDADGKTGDGAGIHLQIPQTFFREHIERTGHNPGDEKLAVGMVFLPRTDYRAQERCRVIVEREILRFGYRIYGWRQVPINTDIVGEKGHVYCVEFASRSIRELVNNVAAYRVNMSPFLEDARFPEKYAMFIPGKVECIYCDIAQPEQAKVLVDNADVFLKQSGWVMLAVKAQSIDVTKDPLVVYKQEAKVLEKRGFNVKEIVHLEPYDKAHAMILAQK